MILIVHDINRDIQQILKIMPNLLRLKEKNQSAIYHVHYLTNHSKC